MAELLGGDMIADKPLFTIVEDTREQSPLSFVGKPVAVERATVKIFDYCIAGDDGYAVERKSLADFIGSLGNSKRWQRELNKLRKARDKNFGRIDYVVEGAFSMLLDEATYSFCEKLKPHFLMKRWRELTYREGVHVHFCDTPTATAEAVYLLLKTRNEEIKCQMTTQSTAPAH